MTVIAAFGSFYLAESFHASGILSTLTAGMVLGNLDRFGALTEKGLDSAHSFWEFACFVANSFIFIVTGFSLAKSLPPVTRTFLLEWTPWQPVVKVLHF